MRFGCRLDRRGQSLVEYMLFITALVIVFIGFTLKSGLMHDKVEETLDAPAYMLHKLNAQHAFTQTPEN